MHRAFFGMICAFVRNFICSHINVLSDEALHRVCTDDEMESLGHCLVSNVLGNAGKLRGIYITLNIDRKHGFSCLICSTLEHSQLVAIIDGMKLLMTRDLSKSYVAPRRARGHCLYFCGIVRAFPPHWTSNRRTSA